MLDRLTRGRFLSAGHRVRNTTARSRLSFAFFFDPGFNAEIKPLPIDARVNDNKADRWDSASRSRVFGNLRGVSPGQSIEGVSGIEKQGPALIQRTRFSIQSPVVSSATGAIGACRSC